MLIKKDFFKQLEYALSDSLKFFILGMVLSLFLSLSIVSVKTFDFNKILSITLIILVAIMISFYVVLILNRLIKEMSKY